MIGFFTQLKSIYNHVTRFPCSLKTFETKFSKVHNLTFSLKQVFKGFGHNSQYLKNNFLLYLPGMKMICCEIRLLNISLVMKIGCYFVHMLAITCSLIYFSSGEDTVPKSFVKSITPVVIKRSKMPLFQHISLNLDPSF